MSTKERPLEKVEGALDHLRETVKGLTGGVGDTIQSARIRPIQRYRMRGGGPLLTSIRTNLDKRPKLIDKIRARLPSKGE